MGLFAKLISHYVEKTPGATAAGGKRRAGAALVTDELTQLPNRRALFKQLALRFAPPAPSSSGSGLDRSRWFQSH